MNVPGEPPKSAEQYRTQTHGDVDGRFTFPAFRNLLSDQDPKTFVRAIEHVDGDTATTVAAVVGRITDDGSTAKLLSVLVDAAHRQKGLASTLVHQFLEWACANCAAAEMRYTTRGQHVPAMEALLAKTKWPSPQTSMIFTRADPVRFLTQDWVQRQLAREPRSAEPFSWEEITPTQRASIARRVEAGSIPSEVSPLWDEENIVPDISIGLRRGDEVVGWMVCHTIPALPRYIRYSRSFASIQQDARGNGPWLMAHAVQRHVKSSIFQQNPRAMFDLLPDNKPMMMLFDKRMRDYMDEVYDLRISQMTFNS